MQTSVSRLKLSSIAERLLRNKFLQTSCSSFFENAQHYSHSETSRQTTSRGFAAQPAAEPENWQDGIAGAKAFDVTQFTQEKVNFDRSLQVQ